MSDRALSFTFGGEPWALHVYETTDKYGEKNTRAAAYCMTDATPRGPRRAWTVTGGALIPWEPRYEGDWPELDAAALAAMQAPGVTKGDGA